MFALRRAWEAVRPFFLAVITVGAFCLLVHDAMNAIAAGSPNFTTVFPVMGDLTYCFVLTSALARSLSLVRDP